MSILNLDKYVLECIICNSPAKSAYHLEVVNPTPPVGVPYYTHQMFIKYVREHNVIPEYMRRNEGSWISYPFCSDECLMMYKLQHYE